MNSSRGSVNPTKSKAGITTLDKNADVWAENIHLTHDHLDPEDAITLQRHNKLLCDHDKYVEYITHVENAKHNMYRRHFEEMQALVAGGQKSNHRYIELTYIVNENEEEVE